MPGFYCSRLKSSEEQRFAEIIEERWLNIRDDDTESIEITLQSEDEDAYNGILRAGLAVMDNNPEIFYLKKLIKSSQRGNFVTISVDLLYSPFMIRVYKYMLDSIKTVIMMGASQNASPLEKEQMIFEYLQTNVKYTDDGEAERSNIIGALIQQKAVCSGISKAFAYLCHHAGIPCICVFDDEHMWNIVKIDSHFTNVDATYGTSCGLPHVNYTYFNVTDYEMSKHHNRSTEFPPGCNWPYLSYYYRKGVIFNTKQELAAYVRYALEHKAGQINVKLTSGDIHEAVEAALDCVHEDLKYLYNPIQNTAAIIRAS